MCRKLVLFAALFLSALWSDLAKAQTFADPPSARLTKRVFNQAIYSPDGKILAAPGNEGIWLYDPETLEQIGFLDGHQGMVWSVAFSPDSRYLVSGGADHTVRLWEVAERREVGGWEGHKGQVFCVAFSPDGRLCASGSIYENTNEVWLWDAESQQGLGVLSQFGYWVFALAFSPDGQRLAVATGGPVVGRGALSIWEVGTRKGLGKLAGHQRGWLVGHQREVTGVAFSPDGRYLASTSFDGTVRLWDATTYQEIAVFQGGYAQAVSFSPDGRYLATSPPVSVWDVERRERVADLDLGPSSGFSSSISFSPRGDEFALAVGVSIVYLDLGRTKFAKSYLRIRRIGDWETPHPADTLRVGAHFIRGLAISPDGLLLAAGEDTIIHLWDLAQGRLRADLRGHAANVHLLAFSADGHILASTDIEAGRAVGRRWREPRDGGNGVRLWDVEKGEQIALLRAGEAFNAIAFAPDRPLLAGAEGDGAVWLWDVDQLREIAVLRGSRDSVTPLRGSVDVAFSPDGRLLASTGERDGTVQLWDVDQLAEVGVLQGHMDGINSLAFSSDGKLLASIGVDRQVRLWDMAAHDQVGMFAEEGSEIGFIPGSRLLAVSSGRTTRLWEVSEEPRRLGIIPTGWFFSIAFTPDGRYLATGDFKGAVHLWRIGRFQQRELVLEADASSVSLALSPDARFLAIGNMDWAVGLWDVARLEKVATFPVPRGSPGQHDVLAFSPDGALLAVGGGDYTVRLWDVARGHEELPPLRGITRLVYLEFSADGKHLISLETPTSVELEETVRLWNLDKTVWPWGVAQREQVAAWPGKKATFSPDGRLLAFSTGAPLYHQIVLWDLAAQREITRLQGHEGTVLWLGFSPDSRFLASGSLEVLWLWDVDKGEPAIPQPYRGDIATFSPDGRLLAVGQHAGAVHLWDRETGQEVGVLGSGSTPITWMRFSADGKMLLVRSEGRPVQLWDMESQRFLKELGDGANLVAFSANGRTLATGSGDGAVVLWGARPSPVETAVEVEAMQLPQRTALWPAYPNPFNAQVVIPYQLAQEGSAELVLYNLTGQVVRRLVAEVQKPGQHKVGWDGRDDQGHALASGVYFYRLETAGWTETRKMLVLR